VVGAVSSLLLRTTHRPGVAWQFRRDGGPSSLSRLLCSRQRLLKSPKTRLMPIEPIDTTACQ